ncbi:FtsX-like permease family protein [Colwellia hornerae]|uniref:FtsX-like permease family protein n=1 Tax=Colwellia hornerae TaxID=89402 RepID=A0A5C6QB34_9GAMM|nr:FtsX-like permease family protein [Colwellia hornerae]TWX59518.1 FtsX-like permease family protein [Colwellia hornerae]TWX62888.1 FtsX-like permease family protein [Colwellia hornerae]TWX65827.1 FtsX-like permease family protein [Colwellia hornerae]
MSTFIDIKYAFRLLFKSPKFTAMTLAVLIGGLSISLFTFSFLYSTMYKDLPLPNGDTMLSVNAEFNGDFQLLTSYEFSMIKEQQTVFSEFGIYDKKDIRLSFEDSGKNVYGTYVDEGFLNFSGTKAVLGRTLQIADMAAGASPVAVISTQIWMNDFSSNKNVIGMTIIANDIVTEIVGVMPQGYRFPGSSHIWLPIKPSMIKNMANNSNHVYLYGRIKPGMSKAKAEQTLSQQINTIYQQSATQYNLEKGNKSVRLWSFPFAQMGGEGTIMFTFLNVIAGMILLLACINVGNLLLARSIERQKETAIRAALGASNNRLVSQLMWEGIIITVLGGVLSVLLVGAALHYTDIILHSWNVQTLVFWWHWGMDKETLLMAVAFTLVTIFLSSFLPAWRSANQDINTTLRDGTRGAQGKKAGRLSRFLVTTQVFLVAILMLVGAMSGYISHKLVNLETGDNYTNVMKARLSLPENKYPEPQQQIAFYQSLIADVKSHPRVVDVVMNNWLGDFPLTLERFDYTDENSKPSIDTLSVIGKTDAIGVDLVDGRFFTHQDKEGNRKVAMISQSMASRYWPGESVIGKSFQLKINDKNEKLFIVGVVTNRMNPKSMLGKLDSADEIYTSGLQFMTAYQNLYYLIEGELINTEEIFYQALYKIDRNIDLFYAVQPAEKNRGMMRDVMQLTSNITFGTGFFALMLALVGIYGLTANSVAQRTHEVGIRRAVGATDKSIVNMFLKQGAKQLIKGLGLALVIFALMSFGFNKMSEGLFPTYLYIVLAITVVIGLSAIVMLAIYAPTQRAVKMEPSSALRYE